MSSVGGAGLGSYIREAIQKSVGTDDAFEGTDGAALTTLLDSSSLTSITNKEDALDLDTTEIQNIIELLKQTDEKKYADIIVNLTTVKTTLDEDSDANICAMGKLDKSMGLLNDLKNRDTIDDAYIDDFKTLDLCHQKEILIEYAGKAPDKLKDIFEGLDNTDAEIILLDLSIDLRETSGDKAQGEEFLNNIVKNYLLSDPDNADDKVTGLTALIESEDITDTDIKDNLTNALQNALDDDDVGDMLSIESKSLIENLETATPQKSEEQQEIDDFYGNFFEERLGDVLTDGDVSEGEEGNNIPSQQKIRSTLLRESGKTPEDMADAMISKSLTDPAHIITVMGNLPEGRYQMDFITQMLGNLNEEGLNDLFPLLMGQVLVLQSQGEIDDDDLENLFEAMDSSANSDNLLELLQDYGADINDLSDITCLSDAKLRNELMADWQDMMEEDSNISSDDIDAMVAGGTSGKSATTTHGTTTNAKTTITTTGATVPPPASSGTVPAAAPAAAAPPMPAPVASPFESYGHGFTQGFVAATMGMGGGMPPPAITINVTGNNNTINL